MNTARRLRFVLYVQAGAVAVPIAASFVYIGYVIATNLRSPCVQQECPRAAPAVFLLALALFAAPCWWALSGARRAARLSTRQLAWLLAVNAYLMVLALDLWAQTRAHMNEEAPLSVAVDLVTICLLPSSALLSSVACAARIVALRHPTRAPL